MFGSIPLIFIIVGINFCGSNLSKLFLKILFFSSLKSLNILSFSFSSESAGLKSIFNEILFSLNSCWIFLYLTKCAELLNIVGPDTPKWVNNISPKSSYITLFLFLSINSIWTFFKDNPCKFLQVSLSKVSKGTNDGFIFVTVCPNFCAITYPSPVEPVSG